MKKETAIFAVLTALIAFFISTGTMASKENGIKMDGIVILETSNGNIEIQLDSAHAPITVANFLKYVNEGFYNGTIFHRAIPNFMAQAGGFTSDGTEKQTHEPIKLESNNGLSNKRGMIAMARTNDPDSATSQFFINVADNYFLDYGRGNDGYAVFGNVTKGMDVADAIVSVKTGDRGFFSDWPVEDIIIKGAYVKK
ncbi:MAG: peptidyl-prolyl cis-trans isomerase [Candidatus Aenigmarchaeota archaeon]|nr:peptidyl-prolyl cis-trans isomerase [Candidatus Aenigmarchaeota archaeon]